MAGYRSNNRTMLDKATDRSAAKPRIKTWAPKVKTGCGTCRIRRVKCDEIRPFCNRCTSTDRICDGYKPIPARKPYEKLSRIAPSGVGPVSRDLHGQFESAPAPLELPIATNKSMTLNERRSFEYFQLRTVPQLSGFFDSSFWSYSILQVVDQETAVRHAVIALGSLHERFEAGDPRISRSNLDIVEGGFALAQYMKAVRCLIDATSGLHAERWDLVVVTCLLFTCFEALRGHHGSALSHVKNGINMLREVPKLTMSTNPAGSRKHLVPYETMQTIFARLDCQSIRLGADVGPLDYISILPGVESGFREFVPPIFSSLEAARNSLEFHERQWLRCVKHTEWDEVNTPAFDAERQRQLNNFVSWESALARFLRANNGKLSVMNMQATKLLRARYLVTVDMLSVSDPSNEMSWDEHTSLYADIVTLAAEVTSDPMYSNMHKLNGKIVSSFALDNGIAGPLFHVVRRCRDPTIRRKAVDLWCVTPRQEGVWDGMLAFKVGQRMMQLEEESLQVPRSCEDIPRDSRIVDLDLKMYPQERRADVFLTKRWNLNEVLERRPGELIKEVLTW